MDWLVAVAPPEHEREIVADPIVFGVVAFVILLILLTGVLMFGKGRPHS